MWRPQEVTWGTVNGLQWWFATEPLKTMALYRNMFRNLTLLHKKNKEIIVCKGQRKTENISVFKLFLYSFTKDHLRTITDG